MNKGYWNRTAFLRLGVATATQGIFYLPNHDFLKYPCVSAAPYYLSTGLTSRFVYNNNQTPVNASVNVGMFLNLFDVNDNHFVKDFPLNVNFTGLGAQFALWKPRVLDVKKCFLKYNTDGNFDRGEINLYLMFRK